MPSGRNLTPTYRCKMPSLLRASIISLNGQASISPCLQGYFTNTIPSEYTRKCFLIHNDFCGREQHTFRAYKAQLSHQPRARGFLIFKKKICPKLIQAVLVICKESLCKCIWTLDHYVRKALTAMPSSIPQILKKQFHYLKNGVVSKEK